MNTKYRPLPNQTIRYVKRKEIHFSTGYFSYNYLHGSIINKNNKENNFNRIQNTLMSINYQEKKQ